MLFGTDVDYMEDSDPTEEYELLAQAGYEASKSEVLRAGVALLASRGLGEIINLVGDLPKVPKGKRGKKH